MCRHGRVLLLAAAVAAFSVSARQGSFLDSLTFITEPSPVRAIERFLAGDIDIVSYQITGADTQLLEENHIPYSLAFSGKGGVLFNTPAYSLDGRFNPLGDRVIRQAVQKLCDRDLLISDFMNGNALAMYSPIPPTAATYPSIIGETTKTAVAFAYDEALALEMIEDRMIELGAERNDSGNWTIADRESGEWEAIEIIGLIRLGDARHELGDYFCDKLEEAGFTTRRTYGSGGELATVWAGSLPEELTWHFYTEGYASGSIDLTSSGTWAGMYTDLLYGAFPFGRMDEEWCSHTFGPGFYEAAARIANGDYTSAEERLDLFQLCEERARENPTHLWVWNVAAALMNPEGIGLVHDISAGPLLNRYAAHLLRFDDVDGSPVVGGDMVAANREHLVAPINPVDGAMWTYDLAFVRPTQDLPVYTHPHTGIPVPHMLEKADVVVLAGRPVILASQTEKDGWCTLQFADAIGVPGEAWGDWDPSNEVFVPIREIYPDGVADCVSKTTLTYPDWLLDGTVVWHDGSPLTLADLVCGLIVGFPFDAAFPESEVYDPYRATDYNVRMSSFRGLRIASEEPLVVEVYSSAIRLYAETIAAEHASLLWPISRGGTFTPAWHQFAVGYVTEARGLGTFGASKAAELGIDQISYVAGEQLTILLGQLETMNGFTPFAPTLGRYLAPGEADERFDNLGAFAEEHGHLWIGTGPMYLDQVDTLAGITVLRNNPSYFLETGHYVDHGFDNIAIPEVSASGPSAVRVGDEASFEIAITIGDEPCPQEHIREVVYILVDASGQVALEGLGQVISDGLAVVMIPEEDSATLAVGGNLLEIAVVVDTVVLPGSASVTFATN
jgi:peptide/nickel transport system substrate-binding protein